MSSTATLPMASAAGKNQFERERLARIAMIEAKMKEIMQGVDTSLISKQPSMPKAKASGPKKRKAAMTDQDIRRSSRIHNMPVPLYCIEEDPTDCPSRSRRHSTTPCAKGPNGRRCHGAAAAAALFGGAAEPYMVPLLGWKQECGSAGLAAAEAATDAALALVQRLGQQGRPAVVKLMSASQVSGGFWCQLPIDLAPHYGTDKQQHKRTLSLHCFDKAQQDPEHFMYAQPGSSSAWPVVFLPRGEGSGLSGGWRGFAIDQRIFPNDTVVFACLDAEPTAPAAAPTAAAAASTASEVQEGAAKQPISTADMAEDSGCDTGTGGAAEQQQQQQVAVQDGSAAAAMAAVVVKPQQRMHMQAYIFRAFDYEDSTKQQQQQLLQQPPTPQQGADAAALGRMGSLTPGASSQPQQQQQQQGEDQLFTTADEDDAQDALGDVPLAKRAKYLETGPDAALQQQQQQPPMSPEQQAVQQLGLMEAAEAGVLRVRVARQGSSGGSSNIAAKPPATAGSGRPQQKEAAAAAGGVGCKRQAGKVAAAAAPRQKRAAAAAASKAWGGAPRNFASSSNASSSSSRAKAACGVKLVPKPADPSQLVPAPTKAELASGNGGSSYEVEAILAHRVNAGTGADEFLISWAGYGPYWDSWEGLACLEGAPGSYAWQGGKKAIPRKFRL